MASFFKKYFSFRRIRAGINGILFRKSGTTYIQRINQKSGYVEPWQLDSPIIRCGWCTIAIYTNMAIEMDIECW